MSFKDDNKPKQPQRRKLIQGATALVGMASIGFPYISLAQNKPIRVGMPTILSGRVAMLGQASSNAAQMEVEKAKQFKPTLIFPNESTNQLN